jgi:hypothetical protein
MTVLKWNKEESWNGLYPAAADDDDDYDYERSRRRRLVIDDTLEVTK